MEKIIEKLGKIKNHMESAQAIGNEAEAQAFASMLQNLLMKHKLEMTDIQYSQEMQREPVEEFPFGGGVSYNEKHKRVVTAYPDVEVKSRRCDWMENLAGIIARAHSCATMCQPGSNRVWFVGHKSNVQIVDYLFVTMYRASLKISWKEYCTYYYKCQDEGDVTRARGFRDSFINGFVSRLAQRFEEEKRKMTAQWGEGLVRVNKEALAVRQYLDTKKGKKAQGIGGSTKFHRAGWERGRAVADGLNLNANAVKQGQPNKQIGGK